MIEFRDAIRDALAEELERDPAVVFFGEDVAAAGGVFKVTAGLHERFGDERVFDTPISELAMTGAAYVGLAFTKSHLRTASAEIQDEYRAAFAEVLERHGIAAEDEIEVPYVVDCWIAKRKDR